MIASIAAFLVLASLLTWMAAWAADRALRMLGRPARWVWLTGLSAPFLLLLAPLVAPSGPSPASAGAPGSILSLPPLVVEAGGTGGWAEILSWALASGWVLSSATMLLVLARAHAQLAGQRDRCRRVSVDGRTVHVSDARGPAVAGVLRPWIVLPRWVEELPPGQRSLIVLHEEEHIQAGDTRLLAAALLLVTLAPWNPFAWLHLRGLRVATEVDCDRRVLRRVPHPRSYADSLLTVAARSSGLSSGLAAFTERRRSLETRILAMTPHRSPRTAFGALLLLLLAGAVGVQACYVDSPVVRVDTGDTAAEPSDAVQPTADSDPSGVPVVDPERVEVNPTFTPFTAAPSIVNREEVVAAMREAYPPLLRDAGIGGTVIMYFFIDEEGVITDVRIHESSGRTALDRAALEVAATYRFSPAKNRGEDVPVWVQFPITFQPG